MLTPRRQALHPSVEETWEFDTVRARTISNASHTSEDFEASRSPPMNARIPHSLRGLFGDESIPMPALFNQPAVRSRSNTPTQASSQPPNTQAGPSRGRATPRKDDSMDTSDEHGDDKTARHNAFVFPPRPSATTVRAKSKLSTTIPDSETTPRQPSSSPERTARLLPVGPNHGLGIGDATMNLSAPHAKTLSMGEKTAGATIRPSPAYREIRESRGLPNISIPPANALGSMGVTASAGLPVSSSATATPSSNSNPKTDSPTRPYPLFGRKRSQSSAAASSRSGSTPTSSSPISQRFRAPAHPNDFHFPPVSATANLNGPAFQLPIFLSSSTHSKHSSGGSEAARSPTSSHHATYSLDAYQDRERDGPPSALPMPGFKTVGTSAAQGSGLGLPPSLSRAHSSNALTDTSQPPAVPPSRRMSIVRQASVAVMETVFRSQGSAMATTFPHAPSNSPEKAAFTSANPNANTNGVPIPGLKDVLKIPSVTSEMQLGMTDLLPPSPSAANANRRFFDPKPSSLGSSVVNGDIASPSPNVHVFSSTPSPRSGMSRTAPSSPALPSAFSNPSLNPERQGTQATDISVSTSSTSITYVSQPLSHQSHGRHSRTHSHTTSSSVASLGATMGPAIRPLDFASLMSSHEMTHAALANSVDELVQWLGVVEHGLNGVLARGASGAVGCGELGGEMPALLGDGNGRLEQVREDEEAYVESEDKEARIVAEPEELEALDEEAEVEDPSPGTFEQFLANMQRQKQEKEVNGHGHALVAAV